MECFLHNSHNTENNPQLGKTFIFVIHISFYVYFSDKLPEQFPDIETEESPLDNIPQYHNYDIIWTRKKPTDADNEATKALLALRGKLNKPFTDKKTKKNKLWADIANQLQTQGFVFGSHPAERCRQKFANLQKTYLSYVRHQNTTGAENVEEPPFFLELHSILGNVT